MSIIKVYREYIEGNATACMTSLHFKSDRTAFFRNNIYRIK